MVVENLSQKAVLSLEITSPDPRAVVDGIAKLSRELGHANKNVEQLEKNLARALGSGASRAASSTKSLTSEQLSLREAIYNQSQAYNDVQAAQKRQLASQEALRKSAGILSESELPRLRYALYDVATTALATSAALTAIGTAAVVASASYESAFTGVERTMDPAYRDIQGIRTALIQMSREVPKSFQDLSAIATLGNQLGVGGEDLIAFTDIVSKFSTVSGMTAEASAQAFGRLTNILQYPIKDVGRLASAIELAGVNSAATDQEIIALAQRLGATATRAGFTADQVIGLASALGSLGVAPERAQGVFETYFNSLNESLSEGGKKLQAFSIITGATAEELNQLVRSGQGFDVFQKFLSGLQGADTVQLTDALSELGLSGLRANEVIGRISGNLPLLKKAFDIATKGASENNELNRQYGLILDDLSSKWQILLNSLMGFAAAAGNALAPTLKSVMDALSGILNATADFLQSPLGQQFTQLASVALSLVAAYAALRGGIALATASMFALRTAAAALGGAGIMNAIGALGRSLGLVKVGADGAAKSVFSLRGALLALGRATLVLAALQVVAELIFDFGGAMEAIRTPASIFISAVGEVVRIAFYAQKAFLEIMSALPIVGGAYADSLRAVGYSIQVIDSVISGMKSGFNGWVDGLNSGKDASDTAGSAMDGLSGSMSDATGNAGDLSGALDDVADRLYTLVNYGQDLQGVMQRAFDIQFGGQQGLDTITTGWQSIAKASADARQNVIDYQQTLLGLAADKQIKQYWLSIAERYGDEKRAAKLRAELADLSNQQAKAQQKLAEAQDAASMTLTGNSTAAIQNRANVLGLVGSYQQYLAALASSGVSQEQLAATSVQLKQEFINQATQAGFSAVEIGQYASAFDGMTTAINGVPRDITVTANVDPALQALNEFYAQAAANAGKAGDSIGSSLGGAISSALANSIRVPDSPLLTTMFRSVNPYDPRARVGGWESGGYTGDGPKNAVAGAVHRGEYVFSKKATNALGVNNLAYLHQLGKSGRGYANGGYVGGGSPRPVGGFGAGGPVELGAATIQAIVQGISSDFFLDGSRVASSVSRSFARGTAIGAN